MFKKIEQEGTINFYYNCDDMFNDVCILSAYMVKNASAEEGALLDSFAVTDDEREIYDYCLSQATAKVYESLSKIGKGFDAFAVFIGDKNNYTSLNIIDNKAYNDSALMLADMTIAECLRYGILTEFYTVNAHDALHKMAQDKFANNLLLLNQRLFQLKKKRVSSLL